MEVQGTMSVSISATTSSPLSLATEPVTDPAHERVLQFTRQVFGSSAALSRELDPETSEECLVVTVTPAGSVEQLVAANDDWHRGLLGIAGESAVHYRLSIDPPERCFQ
jgi:hypothetical protein